MGGTVSNKIHYNLAAIISNSKNIQKDGFLLKKAKECNLHVVSQEFLLDVDQRNDPIQSIIKRSAYGFGRDVCSSNHYIIFQILKTSNNLFYSL